MRPRIRSRWRTRFGTFVSRYTVSGLTRDLALAGIPTNTKTVYAWLSGCSAPRRERLEALVTLSGGALSPDDVHRHRAEVARGSRISGPGSLARGATPGPRRH